MARNAARPARSKRGSGHKGGVPWLGLALLIAIGVGVFAARTVKLPRGAEPALVEMTPATQVAAPRSGPATVAAAAATARPTAGVVARPTAAPTRAQAAATLASTPSRASATPQAAATATAISAVTRGTTVGTGGTPVANSATPGVSSATPRASGPAVSATPPPLASRGTTGEVALTFDAGADRGYTEDILDILQDQHVVASFGITGLWAKANADLVRRMAADGHLIINHTLDHRSFTGVSDQLGGLSAARRRAELDDADAILAPLLGHTTRPWYRLPYGDDDARVAADLAPDGYSHKVGWTVDSLGWRGSQSADIVARCLQLAAPGGIYVFHVGRASQDALALPQVIAGLRDKGFSFRRIDQG